MPDPKQRRSSFRADLKKKRAREVWIAIALGLVISALLGGLLYFFSILNQP
jgi:hypothetical protein